MGRVEKSFLSLLENDNITIVIPIIQRDYAQGRNDDKAIKVRNRLLDDWIAVLNDTKKRMDFNFIYGEETSYGRTTVFLPVDGQQRITSLYLLHWYLAFKTNNNNRITKWNFDYKTRNSASEFFSFLKSDTANGLFNLLKDNQENKYSLIQNQSWFKCKWENDPTIVACLLFLIDLSKRIFDCEQTSPKIANTFWERLSNAEQSAIYFTYLPENNKPAEIHAARTYTRMNARGKRLTEFENLKAMIDELESRLSAVFDISSSFDRIYIDYLYDKDIELKDATVKINTKGLNWFRLVYYIYCCLFNSNNVSYTYDDLVDQFEDEIYQLSQGRKNDSYISEFLKMLKAVLELVCNSSGSVDIDSSGLLSDPSRQTIAFVLYAYCKWEACCNESDQLEKNKNIAKNWDAFRNLLKDLNYDFWNEVDDIRFAKIICNIVSKYSNSADYFISHDFDADNPFGKWEILADLKCRVIECKIMWHLVRNNAVSEEEIRDFQRKSPYRIGYLYYLCGYLRNSSTWSLNAWASIQMPNEASNIKDYISCLSDILEYLRSNTFSYNYYLKAIYAYASQYDLQKKQLYPAVTINQCTDEHIWRQFWLTWNDDEYAQLKKDKERQLKHLETMLGLIRSYRQNNNNRLFEGLYNSLLGSLNSGYGDCWLRFALQNPTGGEMLFDNCLKSNYNNVYVVINGNDYDSAIHTYLMSSGYTKKEDIILGNIGIGDKWYYHGNNMRFIFSSYSSVCIFSENTQFSHSTNSNFSFDTYRNRVNMDLYYKIYILISAFKSGNNFTFEKGPNGDIVIRSYKKGNSIQGKIEIIVEEIRIDPTTINTLTTKVNNWKSIIDTIIDDPNKKATGAYDLWLELRSGYSRSVKTNISPRFIGGVRKKWVWEEDHQILANSASIPGIIF